MLHLLVIAVLIGKALLVAGAALAVVYVVTLTLPILVDWFVDRAAQIRGDKSKLAVTVMNDIMEGKCNFVQGIFDTENGQFTGRRIFADQVDEDIIRMHAKRRTTVWN